MPNLLQFWIETGAIATALLLIPLYMGFIHVGPAGAAAYAVVGGLAMAWGEELQFGLRGCRPTLIEVILWGAAITGAGGLTYGLALIFI